MKTCPEWDAVSAHVEPADLVPAVSFPGGSEAWEELWAAILRVVRQEVRGEGSQRSFLRPECADRAHRPGRRARYENPVHRRPRDEVRRAVARGGVLCARCGEPIVPGTPVDLDHADDGSGYLGATHRRCNRGAVSSTRRSGAAAAADQLAPLVTGRRWEYARVDELRWPLRSCSA